MIVLSIWAFLLLGGFLLLTALRFGVPDMVSGVYYQLQYTTDSTVLGGTTEHKRGWIFSVVMIMSAFLMMVCMLDTEKGTLPSAFAGCCGMIMVGLVPRYLSEEQHGAHVLAAWMAVMGCLGWCLSVCWQVTVVVALVWLAAMAWAGRRDDGRNIKAWYWIEVAGLVDVFLTYWTVMLIDV